MLRIRTPQHADMAGFGMAFPMTCADGSDAVWDNATVLVRLQPDVTGRRAECVQQRAMAVAETLGVQRRAFCHPVDQPRAEVCDDSVALQARALALALDDADMSAQRLAAVLAATSSPVRPAAANAPAVAQKVGATGAAFDVRAGCAGGLHALVQGYLICQAAAAPVAVTAGDTFSRVLPRTALAALGMGDGAGCVILQPSPDGALLGAALQADGTLADVASVPGPFPPTAAAVAHDAYTLQADPEALAAASLPRYRSAIAAALACADCTLDDIDLIVPHQASLALHRNLAAALACTPDRVYSHLERHANIGAGSLLVALGEARAEGALRRGHRVVVAALGGGMHWGAAVIRL